MSLNIDLPPFMMVVDGTISSAQNFQLIQPSGSVLVQRFIIAGLAALFYNMLDIIYSLSISSLYISHIFFYFHIAKRVKH